MPHQIFHNGLTYTCIGISPAGHPVWPVEELLRRYNFPRQIRRRLRHKYKNGYVEGSSKVLEGICDNLDLTLYRKKKYRI